ncbi:pyridoxamine 5'-phosphate oxidase family protein [Frigidibacter sp. ROC022]|uniref:pyridoxamine 5'-phosphate oxidase family protein n=1 Tax=Frigidibacter sp. ROC022 TaxID=2971796 RepID=UPI00215B0C44|nr:pyridoxamine 5'-phosphate oxidase family protein [Frigidibacter sp. ROC022]MCR8725049.1 pyridoxamine 5'-phosphate oxidase family protein [Frigidibacter sp. ROC022]
MNDPAAALAEALETCWSRLSDLPCEAVLATVAERGAEARVVMLRRADRAAGSVGFHADLQSPKLAEIARSPGATLLIWDRAARLQLRLRVTLSVRTGAADLWAALPDAARGNYGTVPPPGRPIAAPDAYVRRPELARFGEITGRIEAIDMVQMRGQGDRRALFARDEDWRGRWLAP